MSSVPAAALEIRTKRRTRLAAIGFSLVAIVAAGAWLRFHAIDAKSLWTDEGVSAAFTRLSWYDFGRILWRREANMTLYYLLLRAWAHAGDSVSMLRAFSVVPSLATIPLVYALGRRLFNTGAGLAAALLLSVNAYSVRYAQEVRSYSLVSFLVVLATYYFVRAVESGRKQDWTWYVAAGTMAIYAHFFAVLVLIAHWASLRLLGVPGSRPLCLGADLGAGPVSEDGDVTTSKAKVARMGTDADATMAKDAAAGFRRAAKRIALWTLPIWIFIATTGAGPVKWIPRLTARGLYSFLEQFSGNAGARLLLLYMAAAMVAVAGAIRSWKGEPVTRWRRWLPLVWFVVPVAITLVFSLLRPVFLPRYMMICLPALVLMAAAGVTSFRQRWLALPVLVLISWLAVGGVQSYYSHDFDIGREDFRGASQYVLSRAQAGDGVLFYKGQGRFPYSYYADRSGSQVQPTIIFPGGDKPTWRSFMGKVTPQMLDDVAQQRRRIWLVLSEPSSEDAITAQIRSAAGSTHRIADMRQFEYVRVYLYEP